jgi:pimeloyl-ACP methyl ester carboxylesterase
MVEIIYIQFIRNLWNKLRKQKCDLVKINLILVITFTFIRCTAEYKKSYEYKEIEVNYFNTKDNIKLSGTLTMPHSNKPVPAVLLIQGSGPYGRDEKIGRHRIFKVMAHHLSKNGIAVLRTDKRGCGKSGGNHVFGDIENFVEDGFAGVKFLKKFEGVDSNKIGLIGHSLGGLIAPSMAVQSSDIKFIVSMGTTGLWGRDALYSQNELWAKSSGVPEKEFANIKNLCYRMYDLLMMDTVTIREEKEFIEIHNKLAKYLDKDLRDVFYPGPAKVAFYYFRKPEFQKSFQLDPSKIWNRVKCPTLLLRGELDHHVSAESHQRIVEALKDGGNLKYENVILQNHNHIFQSCRTGRPSEVQIINEAISKKALNIITNWITSII